MESFKLCSPALIYLVFSMTQVVVDTIKGLYNVAILKFTMMILFTLLLNILCERGLSVISWIIVFIPFILMSVITSILLFVFGLDPSTGVVIPPKPKHPVMPPIHPHHTDAKHHHLDAKHHHVDAKHHEKVKHHEEEVKHHPHMKHHKKEPVGKEPETKDKHTQHKLSHTNVSDQ